MIQQPENPTSKRPSLKTKVLTVPVLGYALRLGASLVHLPKRLDMLSQTITAAEQRIDRVDGSAQNIAKDAGKLSEAIAETNDELQGVNNRQMRFDQRLNEVKRRVSSGTKIKAVATTPMPTGESAPSELFADDHDLDDFYVEFEDKFRGTEDEIKERLRVYLPYFKALPVDFTKQPVLDIGCGRGELLQLLKEESINAVGMDLNESMVEECKEKGLTAIQDEALSYLRRQETGSLAAITGFHIVEHIPFNFLLRLFAECHRVLVPGGIVIFETPNPENIHVGSFSFYYDPSHLHPLAPEVLAFAVENRGFERADILRLHPKDEAAVKEPLQNPYMNEVVRRFYMEQDYAVIGYKELAEETKTEK